MDNELKLLSPAGADSVLYYWPLCKTKQYNGAAEIVDTIRWVTEDCPELKLVLEKYIAKGVDLNSYETMKILCDKYNKSVTAYRNLWKGATKPNSKSSQWASPQLLRHIIQQCYNRSVVDPDKLNQYEPFSPEVYGETSFDLVNKMLDQVKLSEDDVFIDLGSGVGQVVIQVAAASRCAKCIGIEKSDVPAEFASSIEKEFRKWMKFYGKKHQDFELIKGDFFDPQFREAIMSSNLVFVNNFAFGPAVDHKLKLMFADMKDGTKIVSSKAFCPINFRVTDRHMTDIGSIMNIHELSSMPGAVSWTGKPVTYFLHTIDRSKLESYFNTVKNNGNGNNGHQPKVPPNEDVPHHLTHRASPISSGSNNDSSSPSIAHHLASTSQRSTVIAASSPHSSGGNPAQHHHQRASKKPIAFEEDESIVYGPTTRRQWSSWVAQQEKNKRKNYDKEAPSKLDSRGNRPPKKRSSMHIMPPAKSPNSPHPSVTSLGAATGHASDKEDNSSTTSGGVARETDGGGVMEDVSDDDDAVVVTRRSGRRGSGFAKRSRPVAAITADEAQDERLLSATSPISDDQSMDDEDEPTIVRRPGRPRKTSTATTSSSAALLKARQDAAKRKYHRKRKLRRASLGSAPLMTSTKSVAHGGGGFASPGSGAKTTSPKKKSSADWIEALDFMHKRIVDNVTQAPTSEHGILPTQISTLTTLHSPKTDLSLVSPISTVTSIRTCDDPMAMFLQKMRNEYEQFILYMQSEQFRRELITSIEVEQKRQRSLTQRKEQLEKQVQMLQEEGSLLLNNRLAELDMKAVTPAELLNKAKEIVVQHQDLQAKAANLEAEIKGLELQNQQLLHLTRAHDEAALKSPLAQSLGLDALSHDEAKKAILMEIGTMFSHRKAYLNEISRMENEIRIMESFVQLNSSTGSDSAGLMKPYASQPCVPMIPVAGGQTNIAASIAPASHHPTMTNAPSIVKPAASLAPHQATPVSVVVGRRPRGSGRGGRGASGGTGLRRRPSGLAAAATVPCGSVQPTAGDATSAVATSGGPGSVGKSIDAQRRDDIDEQVEEMVRKIKNMNSAATLCAPEKEKRAKPVAPTATEKKSAPQQPLTVASTAKPAESSTLTPTSVGAIEKRRHSEKKRATPSSIDQTVDAVCHGYSSVAPIAQQVPPDATSDVGQPPQPVVAVATGGVAATRRGSVSSVTDSIPSDHDEDSGLQLATEEKEQRESGDRVFVPISDQDRCVAARPDTEPASLFQHPLSTVASRRSSSVGPDIGVASSGFLVYNRIQHILKSEVPTVAVESSTSSTMVDSPHSSNQDGRTGLEISKETNVSLTRSSSVPAIRTHNSVTTPTQSPSPFSIGALLIDERPSIFSGEPDMKANITAPYPRVRSANAFIDHTATPLAEKIPSDHNVTPSECCEEMKIAEAHQQSGDEADASPSNELVIATPGFEEANENVSEKNVEATSQDVDATSASPPGRAEPRVESIPSPNPFKNTSNTGQPGNPHEYSNPGNPQALTSSATAAPRCRTARPIDAASPQDVIESKMLLNPFRIPRRSVTAATATAATTTGSVTNYERRSILDDNHQRDIIDMTRDGAKNRQYDRFRNHLGENSQQTKGLYQRRQSAGTSFSNTGRKRRFDPESTNEGQSIKRQNRNDDGTKIQSLLQLINPIDKKMEACCTMSTLSSGHPSQPKSMFSRFYPSQGPPLTRESLERHVAVVSNYRFSQQGLMEALLEHKMSVGKIESHNVLAAKLDAYFASKPINANAADDGSELVSQSHVNVLLTSAPGPKTPDATPPSSCRADSAVSPKSGDDDWLAVAMADNEKKKLGLQQTTCSPDVVVNSTSTSSKLKRQSQQCKLSKSISINKQPKLELVDHELAMKVDQKECSSSKQYVKTELIDNDTILNQLASLANIDAREASKLVSQETLEALKSLEPAVLVLTLTTLIGTLMGKKASCPASKKLAKAKVERKTSIKVEPTSPCYQEAQVTSTCDVEATVHSDTNQQYYAAEEMDLVESSSSGSSNSTSTSSSKASLRVGPNEQSPSSSKKFLVQPPPVPPVPPPVPSVCLHLPPLPPPLPPPDREAMSTATTISPRDLMLPPPVPPRDLRNKFPMPIPPLPLPLVIPPPMNFSVPPPPLPLLVPKPFFTNNVPPAVTTRGSQQPPSLMNLTAPPQGTNNAADPSMLAQLNFDDIKFWNGVTLQVLYALPCQLLATLCNYTGADPPTSFFKDYKHLQDPLAVFTSCLSKKATYFPS